ncbi:DUF2023 family protein [Pyramidobacter sp. YE332]|uniref:DUF2023 family protein n=1 Tax=unclassified Pyramidobacter TaxID=2632171 RepID=UPI00098E8E6C|nr:MULTISPECIES: DUF2023 family protein [unclassified Pyramidobacter]OON87115.1 hypothetical protein B0D78_10715 [Pyramidobacter sp. C12-8]WOL40085.1 DUF2023 family protein [Pyramidobacter sp. YE332]
MEVFRHHIYEFKKGLRNLILHTAPLGDVPEIERTLQAQGIAYRLAYLKNGHVNVFFGSSDCIRVLEIIGKNNLCDFTKEEDFILGIMLGYGRLEECRRFISLSPRGAAESCAAD